LFAFGICRCQRHLLAPEIADIIFLRESSIILILWFIILASRHSWFQYVPQPSCPSFRICKAS
jgi:hypothetical protein